LALTAAALAVGIGSAAADGKFGDHGNDLPLYLTRTLDATAQDTGSPGNMWAGTGIPATNFLVQINPDAGVELGLKAHLRQGPDIPPTYVDDDGRVHVVVPSGQQPANSNRAAWNFTFSVNAALPEAKPSLEDYEVELLIDLDPSKRTDFLKLKLDKLGPPEAAPGQHNGYGWKAGSTVAIPDDEGTDRVTQNSQNLAFYASAIDTNPKQPGIQPYTFGPGEFDIVLSIRAKHGKFGKQGKHGKHGWWHGRELARVHAVFDVVDP
jgi:hypothetical protein